jgi:hypothetical protein
LVIIFLANVLKERTHGYSRQVYQQLELLFESASSAVDRGVEPRSDQAKDYSYVSYLQEEFEDTKRVIRIRISKKNRQHNGQKKKYKRTNNDLQNITHKTKDRVWGCIICLFILQSVKTHTVIVETTMNT